MLDLEHMDAWEMRRAASPAQSESQIANGLSWTPMDEEWRQTLIERGNSWWLKGSSEVPTDSYMMQLMPLRDRLLSLGGESVCFPGYEEDLRAILERGVLWNGSGAVLMRGIPSQCHGNSANLWSQNTDKTTIMTGYAMSHDGMWRQHSWLVAFDSDNGDAPYLVETTEYRAAYYGFAMTYDECARFLYENS